MEPCEYFEENDFGVGVSKYKVPEKRMCLVCLNHSIKACVMQCGEHGEEW